VDDLFFGFCLLFFDRFCHFVLFTTVSYKLFFVVVALFVFSCHAFWVYRVLMFKNIFLKTYFFAVSLFAVELIRFFMYVGKY